jgi:hypothetical protein
MRVKIRRLTSIALLLTGFAGAAAGADVKFREFNATKMSPNGCIVNIRVEMLFSDEENLWHGNIMYQPPNGPIERMNLVADWSTTRCADVMLAERCEGFAGYDDFTVTVDLDGRSQGRLYFRLWSPVSKATSRQYDVPHCLQPVAPIQPPDLQQFRANPDPIRDGRSTRPYPNASDSPAEVRRN